MINQEYYGNQTAWPNASYQATTINSPYRCKKAWFGGSSHQSQLQRGRAEGIVTYGEMIDKSICFAGLGVESPLSQINYAVQGDPATVISEPQKTVTNWFLWEKTNGAVNYTNRGSLRFSSQSTYLWTASTTNATLGRYIEPFVCLPPKNQCLLIYVRASASDNSNAAVYTLDDYVTTYYLDHPRVLCVYAAFSIGNNTPRDANARTTPSGEQLGYMFGYLEEFKPNNQSYICMWPCDVEGTHFGRFGYLPLMGPLANANAHFASQTEYPIFCGDPQDWTVTRIDSTSVRIYRDITDITAFRAQCLQAAACFGLFFTDKASVATNGAFDDPDMYLGLLDLQGIGHGRYSRGIDNRSQPQWDWYDMHESSYSPSAVDNTIYNDTSTFNDLSIASFNTLFAIQASTSTQLARVVGNAMRARTAAGVTDANEWALDTFGLADPMDVICGLKKFPCTPSPEVYLGGLKPIFIGRYQSDLQGYPFTYTKPYRIIDFAFSEDDQNIFTPQFDDSFLDYEPYTTCTLYVPFCGSVAIPLSEFMGHKLNVKLVIDFITGSCSAYVQRDNLNMLSLQGTCAIDIPISGIQGATLDSQIYQASQNLRAAKSNETFAKFGAGLDIAKSALSLDILGTTSAIAGAGAKLDNATMARQNAEYGVSHIQLPVKQVGGASPLTSQICELCCRLTIERPIYSEHYNADAYAQTVGFACLINAKVNDFYGLTIGTINLDNVAATAPEKELIQAAFAKGVYL